MSRLIDAPQLRDQWYSVAESSTVENRPVPIALLGGRFVLWRDEAGDLVAVRDRCPHRESPLSTGTVRDGCLVCPYHGWTFGSGGRCVEIPSTFGGVPIPPTAHLTALPVTERYGLVWMSPGSPSGDVCAIPQDDDPDFRRINTEVVRWQADATRMVDNFLDVSHFPWVHRGTFGKDQQTVAPVVDIVELDEDFTGYRYEVDVFDSEGKPVHREMTTGFHMPFTVRSTIRHVAGPHEGLDQILLLCSTPVEQGSALFTFVAWRNDDHSIPADEAIAFDREVGAEDQRMLEQLSGELPLDLQATISVQADRASLEWRRRMRQLVSQPSAD